MEKKKILLSISMELYEEIKNRAEEEHRTVTNYITHCIAKCCESNKTDTNDQIR